MVQESIGVPVELVDGRWGQFEVEVDGTTVLSRKGGLIAKFTGRCGPRQVGTALSRLPPGSSVPWQRVVNARFTGVDSENRPFSVTADAVVQDGPDTQG